MTKEKFLELVAAGDWTAHFPRVINPYYATVLVSVPRENRPGTDDYAAFGVLFPWEKDESERTAALLENLKGRPVVKVEPFIGLCYTVDCCEEERPSFTREDFSRELRAGRYWFAVMADTRFSPYRRSLVVNDTSGRPWACEHVSYDTENPAASIEDFERFPAEIFPAKWKKGIVDYIPVAE